MNIITGLISPQGFYELENDEYHIKQNAAKFSNLDKRLEWLSGERGKFDKSKPRTGGESGGDVTALVDNVKAVSRRVTVTEYGEDENSNLYYLPNGKKTQLEILDQHLKATRDKMKMRDFVQNAALDIADIDERTLFFIEMADSHHKEKLEFYTVENWRNEIDKLAQKITVKKGQSSEERLFNESNKIRCNMSQAELITMFYNMIEEGFINIKDKTKVRKMIIENFADSNGKPYKKSYVEKLFKPSNVDDRAANHVSFRDIIKE